MGVDYGAEAERLFARLDQFGEQPTGNDDRMPRLALVRRLHDVGVALPEFGDKPVDDACLRRLVDVLDHDRFGRRTATSSERLGARDERTAATPLPPMVEA